MRILAADRLDTKTEDLDWQALSNLRKGSQVDFRLRKPTYDLFQTPT